MFSNTPFLKAIRFFGLLTFVFTLMAMILLPRFFEKLEHDNLKEFKALKLNARVDSTYIDHDNKGVFTVFLTEENDSLSLTNFYLEDVYEVNIFHQGDSVFKKPGEMQIKVYRGKELLFDGNELVSDLNN